MKKTAIYVRVSTNEQSHAAQQPDLQQWANGHDKPVVWYADKASGKTMDRTAWGRLTADIAAKRVDTVVVWRLDRLGRTAAGLTALFDDLQRRKVNLVSLKDGLDLATPAGRLMANVLAGVAQYEREVISERIHAGIAKAKADGKRWGGSKPGRRKVTADQRRIIHQQHKEKTPIARIARAVGLSRPTIYRVLAEDV